MLLSIYTLLTVANSLLYKRVKGMHWFSLYNLLALLGALAVAMRGSVPDFLSIVVGNLFVVGAYFVLYLSIAAFFGRSRRHFTLQVALVLLGVVTMLQFGYFHPDTRLRLLCYSLVLGSLQAQIAIFISLRHEGAFRRVGGPLAIMLAALSLTNFIRILGVSLHGAPQNYLNAGPFLAWIVVINACLQCGAMVAYVWMTAAQLRRDLEIQAATDPLTGLLNRRAITVAAEQAIKNAIRDHSPVSVINVDLDNFKQINDSLGHVCGDATLITVAQALQRGLRHSDLLARIGGDEFTILLPATFSQQAEAIAQTLRSSIESLDLSFGEIHTTITASFGVAQVDSASGDWEYLLSAADKALYAVKRAGGNSTSLALLDNR